MFIGCDFHKQITKIQVFMIFSPSHVQVQQFHVTKKKSTSGGAWEGIGGEMRTASIPGAYVLTSIITQCLAALNCRPKKPKREGQKVSDAALFRSMIRKQTWTGRRLASAAWVRAQILIVYMSSSSTPYSLSSRIFQPLYHFHLPPQTSTVGLIVVFLEVAMLNADWFVNTNI